MSDGVKEEDFKKCAQSGFCRRNRRYADYMLAETTERQTPYWLDGSSVQFNEGVLTAQLHEDVPEGKPALSPLRLVVLTSSNGVVRLQVSDPTSKRPRFSELDKFVLQFDGIMPSAKGSLVTEQNKVRLSYAEDSNIELVMQLRPWRVELQQNGQTTMVLNERGLMRFERIRDKPASVSAGSADASSDTPTSKVATSELDQINEDGAWEEDFNGNHDPKPNGPTAVALDITFPGAEHVYGIPSHAAPISLKTTRGGENAYTDPYRLYNLDVFQHLSDSPMALYGSVPLMLGHRNSGNTAAAFWLNSAETWIDIVKEPLSTDDIDGQFEQSDKSTRTHWVSESGVLDVLLLPGPNPSDIYAQYGRLTGHPAQPPEFSLGYHQCRWNYLNQEDVKQVDANFDRYDIPYDVIWLDIDHTIERRYFTWDLTKFPDPITMQNNLGSKGRKMVTIVDPHIKNDPDYYVFKEATEKGLWIKRPDGTDFEGWCWPGNSRWIDYLNPQAQQWWIEKFQFDQYKYTTEFLHIWNDMNEPSVFSGPEITMPKEMIHYGNWEHRDVHNLFGLLFHESTARGVQRRTSPTRRPFVLSRAFFPGTQKVSAVWTGDNMATWEQLALSIQMVLSTSLGGIPFVGADVGGFFGNPEPELLVRWYQAGAFQPFFRAHAHLDSKRREPWLFEKKYMLLMRDAIRIRYSLLPFWYTLFRISALTGMPVARPMFIEFPKDISLFANDKQYMLGRDLLICPVTQSNAAFINVVLPGSEPWYDYFTMVKYLPGQLQAAAPLNRIPVYIRGGSIISTRQRIRSASTLMKDDPFTLIVALDNNGTAQGELYIDDGVTYDFLDGAYIHRRFIFKDGVLTSESPTDYRKLSMLELDTISDKYNEQVSARKLRIERVIILGATESDWRYAAIEETGHGITSKNTTRTAQTDVSCTQILASLGDTGAQPGTRCVIRNPATLVGNNWSLKLIK
ncbi:neutral alpha-glucosidase AB [Syncephalis fuscata]|nr:neutral alpha-glucosidase AB [Syncephalis fuscata]